MPKMRQGEAIWIEARQRWQIKVRANGERPTFTSSTPGRKGKIEAERKADAWLERQKNLPSIKVKALWEMYLESIKTNPLSEHYVKQEQMGRLWILPKYGARKVSTITCLDIQASVDAPYKEKGLSRKTCSNVRGAWTALYKYAYKARIDMVRPEFIDLPKGAPVGERTIIQPDGLRTLFSVDTITHYNRPEFFFSIYAVRMLVVTGWRRGELCGLRMDDLDFNDPGGVRYYIQRSINSLGNFTAGKNDNAVRTGYLSQYAAQIVREERLMLKRYGIISPYVFPDMDGGPMNPNRLSNRWITYRTQHGIGSSIHELRHTFISIVKRDVPMEILKEIVGHSVNMDTTGVYGHEVDGELRDGAALVDQAFSRILDDDK